MPKFEILATIQKAWEIFKKNFWFLLGFYTLVFLVSLGSTIHPAIAMLVSFFVSITVITVMLKLYDGGVPQFSDFYSRYQLELVLSYVATSLMYALVVLIGFLLFIVPGIYWALKYQFVRFIVVDGRASNPLEAFKESSRMTEGHLWILFRLFVTFIVINLLGALSFGLGLLITVPLTMLVYTSVYRKLGGS